MKLCDPRHPDCKRFIDGKTRYWGEHIGDLNSKAVVPFFNNVTVYRSLYRTVAKIGDRWIELFKEHGRFCCANHYRDAELIKVAMLPEAIQSHPFCGGAKNESGKWKNPLTRAFVQARKIAKSRRTYVS